MQGHDLYKIFIVRLNRLSVNYMITGAVAGIIYGEPRLTNDMDLVIDLKPADIDRFHAAFPIEDFYCPPVEVIRLEAGRPQRGHFNVIHHQTGFKADIYTSGRDQLHEWALSNRKSVDIEEEIFWVAPPEYVILRKLEYFQEGGSEKHLRDIAGIIEISSDNVDFQFLEKKIKMMHLEAEWQAARNYEH